MFSLVKPLTGTLCEKGLFQKCCIFAMHAEMVGISWLTVEVRDGCLFPSYKSFSVLWPFLLRRPVDRKLSSHTPAHFHEGGGLSHGAARPRRKIRREDSILFIFLQIHFQETSNCLIIRGLIQRGGGSSGEISSINSPQLHRGWGVTASLYAGGAERLRSHLVMALTHTKRFKTLNGKWKQCR